METLSSHYAHLLGLDESWRVESVDLQLEDRRVEIRLSHVGSGVMCPECGGACGLADHAEERKWRHLDTMQFTTELVARLPRCRCPEHGVKTIVPPWAGKHSRFTLLFEAFAVEVLQACRTVKAAAHLLGLSWDAVQAIMDRAVARGLERRESKPIKHLGIDEKGFGRGQDYITVLADLDGSRVLDVAPERTQAAAESVLATLTAEQRLHFQFALGKACEDQGDYAEAQQRYGVVRVLATQLQPKFIWEVDAHEAWLAVLQGRLDAAATRVACALSAATPEQPMYLQVTLAVIQLLEGQLAAAQDRLQASLAYYQRSQERTATCAIAFLLAWIHLQLNPSTRALPKELRSELDWLAGRPRAYFPHWWHPALISQVALWLLRGAEHRAIGQRLFREGFLGTEGVKALLAAAAKRDFRLRDEAVNLLAQLGAVDLHLAEIFRNDLARQVVAGAIQSGQVRAAMVPDLLFELRTAQSHNRNNEIAVAIFLLHLQKRPTHEIAALLDRSYSTVSHTLRGLYEHLGVSETGGRRPNRRDKLYQVARETGLLC